MFHKIITFFEHIICAALLFLSCIEVLYGVTSFVTNAQPLPVDFIEQDASAGVMNGEYLDPEVDLSKLLSSTPTAQGSEGISITSFTKSGTSVHMEVENTAGDGSIEVPLLSYPYYEAYANGNASLSISTGTNGVISVAVPKNFIGSIDISFTPPIIWLIAFYISLISAIGIVCFGLLKRLRCNCSNVNLSYSAPSVETNVKKGGR